MTGIEGFEANQATQMSFAGYTTAFQGKSYKFGLSYQTLSLR